MELRLLTRLKARDLFDYYIYKMGKFVYIVFAFVFISHLNAVLSDKLGWGGLIVFSMFPIVYTVYCVFSATLNAKKQPVKETIINPDGIFSRDSRIEYCWQYSDVIRVIENRKYFYVYLIQGEEIILPKYQLGSDNNVLVLRNFLINNVSARRLRIINNNGSFNDRRKLKFDINKEIALAKSDEENNYKYTNPSIATVGIICILVAFSFMSDYMREKAGYTDSDGEVDSYYSDDEQELDIDGYIKVSERLLIVADDVLEITDSERAVSEQLATVKNDEIVYVENDFYGYDRSSDKIKELNRLNAVLMDRLYEVTALRMSYSKEELVPHKEELKQLHNDIVALKQKCNNEIAKLKKNV